MNKYKTPLRPSLSLPRTLPPHRPTSFRQLHKFRNQANGVGTTPNSPQQPSHSLTHRQSSHSQITSAPRYNQAKSPIKQFVKEKMRRPSSQSSLILRRPASSLNLKAVNQSRLSECSRMQNCLVENKELRETKPCCSLEELKKRVEHLLEMNLERCRAMQSKGDVTSWVETKKAQEVETELLHIQESLKSPKDEQQALSDILERIEMIEGMISGQSGESEAIRRSYFNKKNQFYSTTSFQNKNVLKDSVRLNQRQDKPFVAKSTPKQYLMSCSSSSKQVYQKPQRQYYVPPVKQPRKYQPNRQLMPASSYNSQYLSHKGSQVFPSHHPLQMPLPESSLTVKNSTYQQQYSNKANSFQPFDYRDQDCARNKLKNIQLSYVQSSRKVQQSQLIKKSRKRLEKENLQIQKTPFEYKAGVFTLNQPAETEQQRQYKSHLDGRGEKLKSGPKNQNLLKLKENFRLLAQHV